MTKLRIVSLVVALGLLISPLDAQGHRFVLTIQNSSGYDVYHIYMTSSDDRRWGPDLLGDDVLQANGGTFTIENLRTDEYDVKFVDEDGDDCVLQNIQITGDTSWKLTTSWLVKCEFHQK